MEHIKQNDPRLNEKIQKIGCFFISCADVAQMKAEKTLTAEQINDVWNWSKDTHRIDGLDNITDSASIINRFLRVLESDGHFCEIGTFKDGKTTFYPSVQNKHRHIDALIQKIKQGGKSKLIFVLSTMQANFWKTHTSRQLRHLIFTTAFCMRISHKKGGEKKNVLIQKAREVTRKKKEDARSRREDTQDKKEVARKRREDTQREKEDTRNNREEAQKKRARRFLLWLQHHLHRNCQTQDF